MFLRIAMTNMVIICANEYSCSDLIFFMSIRDKDCELQAMSDCTLLWLLLTALKYFPVNQHLVGQ
jgi:hypothetical protein